MCAINACISAIKTCRIQALIAVLLTLVGSQLWAAPPGSPWGKEYFPNVQLINQDGKKLKFYDDLLKDKVVAINFIYTHCGNSCPAETASLKQVKKLLGDRVGKDIFFYSISVDPEHDTPAVLKDYANRFRVGEGWQFLTGHKEDVVLIRKKFGLYRGDNTEQGKPDQHSINFIIGNESTGQWMKKTPFDEPKSLAWLLSYTLPANKIKPEGNRTSYHEAKQYAKPGKAEDIFRFRCQACHSLGVDDGLGPGLLNVVNNRGRAWLTKWLKAPDEMLAAKDPIAIKQFEKFDRIIMPNLKLTDAEVKALIDYLDENSK